MILKFKIFAKSVMMRVDAYLDNQHCVLLTRMFVKRVLYQIPVRTSLVKLSNTLNSIHDTYTTIEPRKFTLKHETSIRLHWLLYRLEFPIALDLPNCNF